MSPFVTNRTPNREAIESKNAIFPYTYIGTVMKVEDTKRYAGVLKVWINEVSGDMNDEASWVDVRYASPFYGIIAPQDAQRPQAQNGVSYAAVGGGLGEGAAGNLAGQAGGSSQQQGVMSYGMWMVPPDVGNEVLVCFINGQRERGVWFACLPTIAHGMIPAVGAPDGKTPLAEFDPTSPEAYAANDLMSVQRPPFQPMADQFKAQGLDADPVRGPITSSSFRETPSRVFGISTQPTSTGPGHTFVMDDGGTDGKNKLIRIRSSTGNQITMSDDTGMIYMINAQGSGWVEISPSGHIDVYGEAGINMATKGDINFHADGNFNVHAGKCVKIVATDSAKLQGTEELQLHGKKAMLEGVDALHIHSCKEIMITSFKDIFIKAFNYLILQGKCFKWNSGTAKEAEQVPPEKPQDKGGYQTTVSKAPTREPFKEHDGGSGQAGGSAAPAGSPSTSATGPGGMFGGSATGLSTAAVGGGQGEGAASNLAKQSSTTPNNSIQSTGGLINTTGTSIASTSKPITLQNAVKTDSIGNYTYNTTSSYIPGNSVSPGGVVSSTTLNSGGQMITEDSSSAISASSASANQYLGRGGALPVGSDPALARVPGQSQPTGVFGSGNPADQAATGNPAQQASNALNGVSGQNAMSSIPAGQGGGESECFEKGNNCSRPADGGQPGTQSNGPLDVQGCAACYAAGTCSANEAALLDTLAGPESGGAYNVITGGGTFDPTSGHPNIVGVVTSAGPSTAAGRYQITGTNYRNLGGGDYSPTGQDAMALKLAGNRYGSSFASDVASGNVNFSRLSDWTTTSGDANAQKRFTNSQAKYAPGGACNTGGSGSV